MNEYAVKRAGGTTVVVLEGDFTRQPVEAVVNPTNEILQHNQGMATAIVRTGGRVIQEESNSWVLEHGPLDAGEAAVTTGGMLQASHVIHVIGPRYDRHDPNSHMLLAAAVRGALAAAKETGLRSVAMPAISTGRRRYPAREAIPVIVDAAVEWLEEHPDALGELILVAASSQQAKLFAAALDA